MDSVEIRRIRFVDDCSQLDCNRTVSKAMGIKEEGYRRLSKAKAIEGHANGQLEVTCSGCCKGHVMLITCKPEIRRLKPTDSTSQT